MRLDPFEGLKIAHCTDARGVTFVQCEGPGTYPYANLALAIVQAEYREHMRLILNCAKAWVAIARTVQRRRCWSPADWQNCAEVHRTLDNIKSTLSDPELVKLVDSWTNAEEGTDAEVNI